jgi:hypothetical protein
VGGFSNAVALLRDGVDALTGPAGSGVVSWFLAAVFALSGIVKLRRPALAARALVSFQITRRPKPLLGGLLGTAEVALALGLALVPGIAVFVAVPLLWFFTVLIARALRGDEKFACFCFGESEDALSRWTLARTAALALLATLLVFGEPRLWRWNGDEPWLELVAAESLFGLVVLIRQFPPLVQWNRGIFDPPVAADA